MLLPIEQLNKDYIKKLFIGEKKAFKISDVKWIIVPRIDELSLKKMIAKCQDHDELWMYFGDEYKVTRLPDRTYFFNVLNTLYPGNLESLIAYANEQCNKKPNAEG